ncbi:MAG: hypothetical protein ACRCXB_22220 [Aeromonadaceae bacterium]
MSTADKLELHYYFKDKSHSIDALTRNKCEAELLAIMTEAAEVLKIQININSEAFREGGFRDIWKVLGENNNQITILLVIVTIVLSRVPMSDPEVEQLEKEIKKLTIEEKKLNIEKLKIELQEKNLHEVSKETIGKAASHVDNNLKIVKRRSNLYAYFSDYHKISHVGFTSLDSDFEPFSNERTVNRENFSKFILTTNKLRSEVDESAEIVIISPVLKEGRYKWKGIYKDKPISFDMHDSEFKEQVLLEQVSFKHGTGIVCVLRIGRELDEIGEVTITGYSVTTVIDVVDGKNITSTHQGRRFVQAKKLRDSQGDLFS